MAKWVGIYQDMDGTYGAYIEKADDEEEAEYLLYESCGGAYGSFIIELNEFKKIAKAILKEN